MLGFSSFVRSLSCCVLHAWLPKPLLIPFQVREARTPFNAFSLLETAARSDNLAQASPPRLGEMSRGSPKLFARRVAQATRSGFEQANASLRRGKSRLSENARRAPVLCVELSPRRRELA
ncbi:hypothetical protein DEO72_LG2g948 [Vigna unguiculata]|uniref:Uncharacterized protein n=1 Tax=Vigna unguiculata TaxID=3917 RepID=A0A4D6KRE0_VIGUN|nr:hypothetical protein DEO72_LG2g948 [Vigna unguiculata]